MFGYYYTGSQKEVLTAKASNPMPSVVNPPIRSQLTLGEGGWYIDQKKYVQRLKEYRQRQNRKYEQRTKSVIYKERKN